MSYRRDMCVIPEMKTIQPFVQQITEAMSTVLEVEITIVDNNLERIAGTGKFKAKIGDKIPESYILNKVIKTGKHHIIDNPGENELCRDCTYYNNCDETAIIDLPIFSNSRIIGAMCLVSFNEYQRKRLLQKKNSLLLFIKHFSQLISSKVMEEKLIKESLFISEQLKSVLNTINEGIIAINKNGTIDFVNSYVKEKIDFFIEKNLLGKPIRKLMPEIALDRVLNSGHPVNFQKGAIKNEKNIFQIIYSCIPICLSKRVEGAILAFHIAEDANKLIYKMSEAKDLVTFDDLLGVGRIFKNAKLKAKIAAKNDSTILLLGESGTGKELFAKAIHSASKRNKGPFIPINCAAIPDSLLESELFGYTKGAFTGALKEGKPGKFEQADRGTILLDEIGDMNIQMQAKLLRTLEDQVIEKIGSTKSTKVDVRIIAATSKNIEEMVEKESFRNDLYYRISTIPIVLPPLRQRKEDIPTYLDYFRRHFNAHLDKEIKGFTKEAEKILKKYDWPGNVRELKNVVEYAINMEDSLEIESINLADKIRNGNNSMMNTLEPLQPQERDAIIKQLARFGKTTIGKRLAANEIGISLATLYRKIKKYNIL